MSWTTVKNGMDVQCHARPAYDECATQFVVEGTKWAFVDDDMKVTNTNKHAQGTTFNFTKEERAELDIMAKRTTQIYLAAQNRQKAEVLKSDLFDNMLKLVIPMLIGR
jgi:hypothetical protein